MHKRRLGRALASVAVVAAWAALASAGENWPQWRGPAFDGSSSQTGLPTTWGGAEGKNCLLYTSDAADE